MRNFLISLICLILIMCSWGCYTFYSHNASKALQAQTAQLIESSINKGDWISAEEDYHNLSQMWDKYKRAASFFFDSKDINEIDCIMGKAYLYMKAEDISNSSGEFSYLKDRFKFIHENDSITIANIF